jgi:hypothetical protein
MTRAFVALADCPPLAARGDLIVQSERSSIELKMDALVARGVFRELSDEEALKVYRQQKA